MPGRLHRRRSAWQLISCYRRFVTITLERMIPIPEPPPGGFTIADLDAMDEFGHNVELISGGLLVNARPVHWHTQVVHRLWQALEDQVPGAYRVTVEQGVKVDDGTRPEPDVMVVHAEAVNPDVGTFEAADVVLAIEVESPGSERRDRRDKPRLYAEAGIRHFWRIERENDKPVVSTYELNNKARIPVYLPTGVHHDSLKVSDPWAIALDLSQLYRD